MKILTILIGVLAAMMMFGVHAGQAATASNMHILYVDNDAFRNYDLDNTQTYDYKYHVDFAVDFLFYNNAEVDKVKSKLDGFYHWGPPYASPKYARMNNSFGWFFDTDSGRKSKQYTCYSTDTHYRVYADASHADRNWSPSWGFYVLGTAHHDHNENCGSTWYGKSEDAEREIAAASRDTFCPGCVFYDWSSFYNYESYRLVGEHFWWNDGYATAVYVY